MENKLQLEEGVEFDELEEDLKEQRSSCSSVVDEVAKALQQLENLKVNYVTVATKTTALHDACENLLDEQVTITAMNPFLHVIFSPNSSQLQKPSAPNCPITTN